MLFYKILAIPYKIQSFCLQLKWITSSSCIEMKPIGKQVVQFLIKMSPAFYMKQKTRQNLSQNKVLPSQD